jgi:ABC-type polysaccharide/polyol phosphate export permease
MATIRRDASELSRFRDLTWLLAKRELTVRYKRSGLGILWTLLNPTIATIVYSVVFSSILKVPVEDFIIFFLSGYLVWNFFAQATSAASTCVLGCAALFRKHYVPKTVFVIAAIISAMINFCVSLPPLLVLMIVMGKAIHPVLLFLPILFIPAVLFSLGLSFLLAAGTVFFADVKELYQVILSPWFFLTPIVYPIDIIPTSFLPIVTSNPMYYIIECFRDPIYRGQLPEFHVMFWAITAALVSSIVGYLVFSKLSDRFIYYV